MNLSKAITKHNPMRGKAVLGYAVFGIPTAAAGVYVANRVNLSTTKGKLAVVGAGVVTMGLLAVALESLAGMK